MSEGKERNYRYDALRGVCMFLIVLQHFTFKGGYQFPGQAGHLIYVGIDVFVMQTFFFLSGMFSKNPDKNRDHMFSALLWPVIVVGVVFWPLMCWSRGPETAARMFQAGQLPYAMWFLVVLFVYKYFQKFYAKIPHLFAVAAALYLFSGVFEPLSRSGFGVSRMCTFFVSFVMGYQMSMERMERYRLRSAWKIILLGLALVSISVFAVYFLPPNIGEAVKLKASFRATGMGVLEGVLFRSILLLVSFAWMIFLFSIFSAKKGLWAHIGMNTMPVYIFHMVFVVIFKIKGFTFGYFDFTGYQALYLCCLFAISFGVTLLFTTRWANRLYGVCIDGSYGAVRKACGALQKKFTKKVKKAVDTGSRM